MPCINKEWNDDTVKITSLLSKHTTASDEALAISAILKKIDSWILHKNNDQEQDETYDVVGDSPSSPSPKKKRAAREIWTDDEIEQFYNRSVRVKDRRKDKVSGENWDTAYQEYLKAKLIPNKSDSNKANLLKKALIEEGENSTISSMKSMQDDEVATKKSVGDVGYVIPINLDDDDE